MIELGNRSEEKLKMFMALEKIMIDIGCESAEISFINQQ